MVLIRSKFSKKGFVAARVDSYHRGYHVGFRCGIKKTRAKDQKTPKKVRKATISESMRKRASTERLQAYQRGYHLGASSGAQRARAQQAVLSKEWRRACKARSCKSGWAWRKRLEAVRLEAYRRGASIGARRERVKQAKVDPSCQEPSVKADGPSLLRRVVQAPYKFMRRIIGKQPPPQLQQQPSSLSRRAVKGAYKPKRRIIGKQPPPHDILPGSRVQMSSKMLRRTAAAAAVDDASHAHAAAAVDDASHAHAGIISKLLQLHGQPPLKAVRRTRRKRSVPETHHGWSAESMAADASEYPGDEQTLSAYLMQASPTPLKPMRGAGTDRLHAFLEGATSATREPAAFQLRCSWMSGTGPKATSRKNIIVVVGGKCRLWKLNQILAECFDGSEHEFAYEPDQGTTVLGSCFRVSRQLPPGQCNSVPICSSHSAEQLGSGSAFLDDQDYSVAQLFHGKSTRYALRREPSDIAQRVIFASPLLSADIALSLDGIMLDSYDSRSAFDKNRRYGNGRKPLPRIVGSSFLSAGEIEARNIILQGSRDCPNFLREFDASWSAIHASYRRDQRQPLFREDGGDFDPSDLF